jgi:GMP synthase (glutamine-hydrolysing)
MKPVLIIRTGRAPAPIRARHGDFPHWFRVGAKLSPERVRIVDVEAGESLPAPNEVAGALITGSAAMVTERADWSECTAGWIRDAMDLELPMFGVCYGHQLMSHALGGRVDYLPGGREIGTMPIKVLDAAKGDPNYPPSFAPTLRMSRACWNCPRARQCWPAQSATRTIYCAMAPTP